MKIPIPQIKNPPAIKKQRSRVHGWGVFAAEPIHKNKRIIEYAGEKIMVVESEKREERYLRQAHIWCFRVNRRWARDGNVDGNDARFINHSCAPNCYSAIIGHTVLICAGRNIETGEELTFNYYTGGKGDGIPCKCRSGCPNTL